MASQPGIGIPFEIETGDSIQTIEKLAAKIATLESAVEGLTDATKKQSATTKESAVSFGVISGFVSSITNTITSKALGAFHDFNASLERSIAFGSQFQNMSVQFNTSAENLQKLAAIGKPVGVGVEQIARSLNIVERTLGTNQKAFQKWGVDVQKLASVDAAGKFDILIDKIRSINDPAKQAAASFDLLKDRSGAFLKIARSGDLEAIRKDFVDFGLAVSNNAVGALDALGNKRDLLNDIFDSIKKNFVGAVVSSEALQEAFRIVIEGFGKLSKFVKDNEDTIRNWVNTAVIAAADALVFLARDVMPKVIDGLTVFALGVYGAKKAVDLLIASLQLQFDLLSKPFEAGASIAKFKEAVISIGKDTATGIQAIVDKNVAVQNSFANVVPKIQELRDRIAQAALAHQSYAAEAKKASGAFSPESTVDGLKQVNKALEDELALFGKIQALEKLRLTFASQEDQQIAAARAQVEAADKELQIRTQILENQRKILILKGEDGKQIDQQLITLQKTHDINVAIARVQEEIARKQAALRDRIEDITNAQKLTALQIQLSEATDRNLTGVRALNAQHERQLSLLNTEFESQRQILLVQIAQRIAEGHSADDLLRQLGQLTREHDLRLGILKTTQDQESAQARVRDQGEKTLAVFEAVGAAAQFLAGTDFGNFLGGLIDATKQAFQLGQALKEAITAAGGFSNLDFTQKLKAATDGLNVANSIFEKNKKELNAARGAASGAAQGAAFGAAFGPTGAAIGAIAGGLIGFFSGSKFRKIAKDAGKTLGTDLSKEMVQKIQDDAKKLGISIQKAALLNISGTIAESGKPAAAFAKQIGDLMSGIADKSIPAKEGIAELGKGFTQLADEALKAGKVGDKVLVGLIKRSRELKIDSPEIKAFVSQQLDIAATGLSKFIGALSKDIVPDFTQLGADAAAIFGATFSALVSEKGLVAAVDQLGDSFKHLKEVLTDALGAESAAALLAPFSAAFDTLQNEKLRPLVEGISGLGDVLKGLANSGFLDLDTFTTIQRTAASLFDQLIADGADTKTALQAIAPTIQAAISAAEQFGVPLDENTQRLKDLAEQNGITFSTDPQQAMLDVLVEIAKVLGADIPESAKKATRAIKDMGDVSATINDPKVGGPAGGGVTGGTSGRKVINASVEVNLGINENPLATAETAAQMRKVTVDWAADAIADRLPSIISALEAA